MAQYLTRKTGFILAHSLMVFLGYVLDVFSLSDTVIILYLGLILSNQVPEGVNRI